MVQGYTCTCMQYQLYARDIKSCMKYYIDNDSVKICLSNATGNANSIISYKLEYFREQFSNIILNIDINFCKQHLRPVILSAEKQSIVNCLQTLISVTCCQTNLEGLDSIAIDDMICITIR